MCAVEVGSDISFGVFVADPAKQKIILLSGALARGLRL